MDRSSTFSSDSPMNQRFRSRLPGKPLLTTVGFRMSAEWRDRIRSVRRGEATGEPVSLETVFAAGLQMAVADPEKLRRLAADPSPPHRPQRFSQTVALTAEHADRFAHMRRELGHGEASAAALIAALGASEFLDMTASGFRLPKPIPPMPTRPLPVPPPPPPATTGDSHPKSQQEGS